MSEIRRILDAAREANGAAVATVVKVEGSSYRGPGAHLLIRGDGKTVGSISGGCLEADVAQRAAKVLRSGVPTLVRYDSTAFEDLVWGFGAGCAGVIHVLIEPNTLRLQFIEQCRDRKETGVIATSLHDGKSSYFAESERHSLDVWIAAAGSSGVFLETVTPPLPLVIFGAGDDTIPLARMAGELDWSVTVVDHRAEVASRERFPDADSLIVCTPQEIPQSVFLSDRTVAVIMTHQFLRDLELLRVLLPAKLRYLGLLGRRDRADELIRTLRQGGMNIEEEELAVLHAPVGLDLGAETPEAIALSVAAEIQAAIAGRNARSLRDRSERIHIAETPWVSMPAT